MFEKDKLNILSMLDAVGKIFEYTKGYNNADEFYNSKRDFDAAMMNFIVLGKMVTRLSEPFTERFNGIDWYKIRGFRNIVARNYFGIDAEEVWEIIRFHLPKLRDDLNEIADNIFLS
jgi:uncharacterized protein with HEPN domain